MGVWEFIGYEVVFKWLNRNYWLWYLGHIHVLVWSDLLFLHTTLNNTRLIISWQYRAIHTHRTLVCNCSLLTNSGDEPACLKLFASVGRAHCVSKFNDKKILEIEAVFIHNSAVFIKLILCAYRTVEYSTTVIISLRFKVLQMDSFGCLLFGAPFAINGSIRDEEKYYKTLGKDWKAM